jgi:hypothetical protein
MWILTSYSNDAITMFEFEDETEAKESYKRIEGTKILSRIVYYNDDIFAGHFCKEIRLSI